MPREKSRYRDKRSSSYDSESSYERKKSKSKHKRRSRSTDRSESSSVKRKRSTSRSRHRRRSRSRSRSRDKHDSKSRRRSSSRSRSKKSHKKADSRTRSNSRSRSRSRTKYTKSKKSKRRSRSSSSHSGSFDIERRLPNLVNLDDTETKVEKAIKAAEAAGLTMTKIPTYEYKEVEIKAEMPTIHDRNLLAELNNDGFVQKAFSSTRNKKQNQNIVIDLDAQTVKVPDLDMKIPNDDSILDYDALPSEEDLKELWIKKLYQYRKKMLKGEL